MPRTAIKFASGSPPRCMWGALAELDSHVGHSFLTNATSPVSIGPTMSLDIAYLANDVTGSTPYGMRPTRNDGIGPRGTVYCRTYSRADSIWSDVKTVAIIWLRKYPNVAGQSAPSMSVPLSVSVPSAAATWSRVVVGMPIALAKAMPSQLGFVVSGPSRSTARLRA